MDSLNNFLPMWKIRDLRDKVTNVVMNFTEAEIKVREATNDEQWGPHGTLMQEIAQLTFSYENYNEVMSMLWKRMFQERENWRATYKSLTLLNYLLKNGSEKVVTSSREHMYDLRSLENFSYVDEKGKDQGINIRVKVKEMIAFIQDDDKLREERIKAKKNKDKYVGIDSDNMTSSKSFSGGFSDYSRSGFGSGFGSSSGGNFGGFSDKNSGMMDLNDKEWRSSNPSFKDRITDITSKVKSIIDQPPDNDHNLDISDGENDLGFNFDNKHESASNKKTDSKKPSVNHFEINNNSSKKPSVDLFEINNNNSKKPEKIEKKQTNLIESEFDDFNDFVAHRVTPVTPVKNDLNSMNNIDFFSNKNTPSNNVQVQPVPSKTPEVNLFDLPMADSNNVDLLQANIGQVNNIPVSTNGAQSKPASDFDLFDFNYTPAPVSTNSNANTIPTSMTMPNFFQTTQPQANLLETNSNAINLLGEEKKSESLHSINNQSKPSINKTSNMWDNLSNTVDINLDNLSPYSKGAKIKQTNVPMNNLMQNSSFKK